MRVGPTIEITIQRASLPVRPVNAPNPTNGATIAITASSASTSSQLELPQSSSIEQPMPRPIASRTVANPTTNPPTSDSVSAVDAHDGRSGCCDMRAA